MDYSPVPPLSPGAVVAVVAPAGHPPAQELARGVARLRQRYDICFFSQARQQPWGMCAGRDEDRARELLWALSDPAVKAVWAARGGYGTTRILEPAMLEPLRQRPRLVIGFSDITALLSAILTHLGLRTLHGPSVCQLGQKDGPHAPWQDLVDALEQASPRQPLQGLTTVFPGLGEGPLIGGNLTVLNHLVGTPWWPSLEGAVLLLEDVGERPYRLDRCLTQLRQARLLDGLAAVVLGDMTHCDARPPELPVWTWLEEFFTNLRVPTLRGLPVGHGRRNHPLPLGALVRVDATHGQVTFLEGAVA